MMTAKISSKGQVTIPKRIREMLGSEFIEFRVEHGCVVIRPIASAKASLSAYADPRKLERENGAWSRAVAERPGDDRP